MSSIPPIIPNKLLEWSTHQGRSFCFVNVFRRKAPFSKYFKQDFFGVQKRSACFTSVYTPGLNMLSVSKG